MRKISLLLLIIGAVAVVAFLAFGGQSREAPASEQRFADLPPVSPPSEGAIDYEAIDDRIERLMDEPRMVGLAVGIVEDGQIRLMKGYGERLAGSGEEVGTDTRFRWASVSKGVAGTAVAKLADLDRLSLEAPISRYSATLALPRGNHHSATLRDVMSHGLGIWRNAYDGKLEGGMDPDEIRRSLVLLPQLCELGECYSYQNVAFDSSSEAVEKVTGRPYGEALQDLLFRPLGMTGASVGMEALVSDDNWAHPHSAGRRELERSEAYYRVPAAGGVNSSIRDMTIWLQAQMGNFPDIVSDETIREAHRPILDTPAEMRRMREYRERLSDARYGLGWRIYEYAGHRIVGHRGGIDGYRSFILFDPERNVGIVALWNSNTSQPHGLQFELLDDAYDLEARDWLELGSVG